MNDNPKDPAQLGLGGIITNLPAVRVAKKANLMSRVHRRLIEPIELTEQDNELAFQHSVFCQTSLPYRNPGDHVRQWQRSQGTTMLARSNEMPGFHT
jgi:alpha-D-ribose 1-methylphosphonate 5-triphosphate diphosphatase PhnM